jgi:hypothetical protein
MLPGMTPRKLLKGRRISDMKRSELKKKIESVLSPYKENNMSLLASDARKSARISTYTEPVPNSVPVKAVSEQEEFS